MLALGKGIVQVTSPGTVYPPNLDNVTKLCNWPLPTKKRA